LALHWSSLKLQVETDCAEAVKLIREITPNTSVHAFLISEIRELLRERETNVLSINRQANGVSHELAKLGRVQGRTEFWVQNFPREVSNAVILDLRSIF
jgi:hypothetical protein